MEMRGRGSECGKHRDLIQQAQEILIRERAFSAEEAHGYLYELAQARKLFIVEAAGRIVAREWVWTEMSPELSPTDARKWLGRW